MADDGLIVAYLRELQFSVARLADGEDLVAEAEDHLLEAADRLMADGATRPEAEAQAIARFGSAAVIAKVSVSESKKGAAVPTIRTRFAGLALLLCPAMLIVGQLLNTNIDKDQSVGHGLGVLLLGLSLPAGLFGLWGLRARHGGLGRLGRIALGLAVASPFLSMAAGWGALVALALLLAVAILVFGIEMLRASVLPVPPLALVVAGPVITLVLSVVVLAISLGGDNADDVAAVGAGGCAVTIAGLAWLGWHLWGETAVDRSRTGRLSTA